METKRVIVLRLPEKVQQKTIPFAKTYFFPVEDEEIIPRVFSCCLVFPVNNVFIEYINAAGGLGEKGEPDVVTYWHRRNPHSRTTEHGWVAFEKTLGPIKVSPESYLAVVPLLFLKYGRVPKYLSAWQKFRITGTHDVERMTSLSGTPSYVLINGKKQQPICTVCGHVLDALAGTCVFGTSTCLERFSLITRDVFRDNLKRYTALAENDRESNDALLREDQH